MKGYLYLLIAIIGEVLGTNLLKASDGFSKPIQSISAILIYSICFFALSKSMKYLPLNFTYAVWGAIGMILITLFSVFYWKEQINYQTIIGIGLILIGTIIVNIFATNH